MHNILISEKPKQSTCMYTLEKMGWLSIAFGIASLASLGCRGSSCSEFVESPSQSLAMTPRRVCAPCWNRKDWNH
jgi:hypothetical protein